MAIYIILFNFPIACVNNSALALQAAETGNNIISGDISANVRVKVFIWVSFVIIAIFLILLNQIFKALKKPGAKWNLGEALSEPLKTDDNKIAFSDPNNTKPIYVNSSSRLIALIGLAGIVVIDLGIAIAIYWGLIVYNTLPDLEKIGWYIFGQAAIFAPYLANQIRAAFTDK